MYNIIGDDMVKKSKKRLNRKGFLALSILIGLILIILFLVLKKDEKLMIDLQDLSIQEIENYSKQNHLKLKIDKKNNKKEAGKVIEQSIAKDTPIKKDDELIVTVSLGINYADLKVNELGNVPIMMYHGIVDTVDNQYIGGNVDKDGYQRTKEAFTKDLEFYYASGYRMIRLEDYVNGIINVEAGLSPIILTFDDGLSNNLKVTGLDDNGNIIIDPNCAIGILESFKQKYPDYNVTATFFVNGGLFQQSEYNEKILNWLVDNGYDIGNHTYDHVDFTKIDSSKSSEEVGKLYNLLDKYIPNKYINIIALPFGSPYKKTHENFNSIMHSSYENKNYETISALRVGWESEVSPFSKNFDKLFLKRIRAYDNNGSEFDIEMNFKSLEKNKYISDGDNKTITIKSDKKDSINNIYNLEIVTY